MKQGLKILTSAGVTLMIVANLLGDGRKLMSAIGLPYALLYPVMALGIMYRWIAGESKNT